MPEVIKIGILKIGCVGVAPLLEYLLDERAEREDIDVRVVGTGSKINPEISAATAELLVVYKPNFAVVVSPNASLPGPRKAREILATAGIPTIVLSDKPTIKIEKELESNGFGYIIIESDAMIGARREFLDLSEVVSYNGDVMKVLAVTGVLKAVINALDNIITSEKKGEKLNLPTLYVDTRKALSASDLTNPYARAKAMAAHEIACRVAAVDIEACFRVKNWEIYTLMVASAHEMMRAAARLANEAQEIEKCNDTLIRKPHARDGRILCKTHLIEKPVSRNLT